MLSTTQNIQEEANGKGPGCTYTLASWMTCFQHCDTLLCYMLWSYHGIFAPGTSGIRSILIDEETNCSGNNTHYEVENFVCSIDGHHAKQFSAKVKGWNETGDTYQQVDDAEDLVEAPCPTAESCCKSHNAG